MANSIYVPLRRLPASLEQLRDWLTEAMLLFGRDSVRIQSGSKCERNSLVDGSFVIDGGAPESQCLLSFFSCTEEVSEHDGYFQMGDIRTRGDWWFAGVVAYALLTNAGYVVFNDAGELDGQATYSVESLRRALENSRKVSS